MKKKLLAVAAAITLVMVMTACGANDNGNTAANTPANGGAVTETGSAAEELVIKAKNWEFDQKEYRIPKGQPVTITLENNQGMHGLQISNTEYKSITEGKPQTITINEPGTYEIKCSIQCGTGHAGMVSKLIVE